MRFVSFADPLPTDPDALRALLLAEQEKHAEEIAAADQNIARLTAIIKELQRHRFGARSEKIDADQLGSMLEHAGARDPLCLPCPTVSSRSRRPYLAHVSRVLRTRGRGALPLRDGDAGTK